MKRIIFLQKYIFTFFVLFALLLGVSNTAKAAIALRGTATTGFSTNINLTINKPAGVVAGDVMIVNMVKYAGSATTLPATMSGWILIARSNLSGSGQRNGAVFYRVVDGTEGASFTFAIGTNSYAAGSIVAFSGVDVSGSNPFDVAPGSISTPGGEANSLTVTSITTNTANAAVIMFGMNSSNPARSFSGWSTASPGLLTEIYDYTGATYETVGAAWAIKPTAVSTGASSLTTSVSSYLGGILVALKAATAIPTITTLSSSSGCQGATGIVITGTNFLGVSAVNFNGVSASHVVNSATQITATVPMSATNGNITVTTSGGTATSPSSFIVNSEPAVSITGSSSVCVGGTTTLSPTTGGTWASSNSGLATVTNGGIVTGVAAGAPTFIFTLTSTGCAKTTSAVTVNALPAVSITGGSVICVGGTTTLSPTTGGTWISNNAAVASVTNGGIVTGVSAGSATFTFTNSTTGCVNTSSSVTVTSSPAAPGNPTSNSPQCIGFGVTLTRTGSPPAGETWFWQTTVGGTSTANSGTTYNAASSGTYYIRSRNNTSLCWSPGAGSATVVVNTAPTIIGSSGSRCGPGTIDLGANASSGIVNWYDSGGNWIKSGTSYTTPSLSSSATYYVDVTDGGCTSSPRTAVQAVIIPPVTISVGGAGAYCTGSTISLTSTGANLTNQYWVGPDSSGPTGFYSTEQNPVINNVTAANAGTYTVTGSALSGINLVANSDFELGNIGFGSSYTYVTPSATALQPEGVYTIVANSSSIHGSFSSCTNHTPSGNLQMVVNGAAASLNIWTQTVNVVPNTAYQFTYWVQSVHPTSPSKSQLYVNGAPQALPYMADATTCTWKQFVYNWTSGPGITSAILELRNQNLDATGNDFALDDIVFQQACEAIGTGVVTINSVPTAGAIGNPQTICRGYTPAPITSTSAGTGTGAISYEWQTNASGSFVTIPGATAATYTPPALSVNTSYQRRTVATSGGTACYSPYSNQVLITVNGPTVVAGGPNTVCQSASPAAITLTGASFVGAATAAWSIISGGGTLSSTNQTATPQNVTYTPANNFSGTITLRLTTNVVAGLGNCAATTERTITVNPTTAISGQSTGTQAQCEGGTFTPITVIATGGGLTYQWYSNTSASTSGGTSLGSANGAQTNSYTPEASTGGTRYYYCIVTGTCGSATSGISGAFIVNPSLPVSISIVASANPVCLGTSVTFTATPFNGGTPIYQWKVNGSNVGTGGNTYSYTPGIGDLITCILTSNVTPCATLNPATSNTINMTFSAAPVAGTLTPTPATGDVCAGTSVSAIATSGSGGTSPIDNLQYRYDGGAWNTYTSGSNIPTAGHTSVDIQTFRTASGAGCNLSAPVMVSWTINPGPVSGTLTAPPGLSLGAVCIGATISATATSGSGGAGTIADILQYRFDGGGWVNYTSDLSLSTFGHTTVEIQTYRTASGSGCTSSTPVVLSWTIHPVPVSGSLVPSPAGGTYCAGTPVSSTLGAVSGGAGTITDVMQYRFDGGAWTAYTSGTILNTNGHTTVDIQTFRTATGSGCTSSSPVVASWILNPLPTPSEIITD